MRSFNAWMSRMKERLGASSLDDWASFLENYQTGKTPPQSRASRLELITLFFRSPRGLDVLCICWLLLILALVFAFTLLTSWEMPVEGSAANSTAVSRWENGWDGWTNRKLYCSLSPQCDDSSPTFLGGRSSLKYEIQNDDTPRTDKTT
jgi:hypothetical protein